MPQFRLTVEFTAKDMEQAHDLVLEEMWLDLGDEPDWVWQALIVETNEDSDGKPNLTRVK